MEAPRIHLHSINHGQHIHRHVAPAVLSLRGILVGLWITCTAVVIIALLPGVGVSLGNLPGDIIAGTPDRSVRLPIATFSLLVVTLTGIILRINSHLSRH